MVIKKLIAIGIAACIYATLPGLVPGLLSVKRKLITTILFLLGGSLRYNGCDVVRSCCFMYLAKLFYSFIVIPKVFLTTLQKSSF
jgi:predicted membrane metal-binding protein